MAASLKTKLESPKQEVTVKTATIRVFLGKNPATSSSKRQAHQHTGHLVKLVQDQKHMVQAYIDKLPARDKEAEQTRLNTETIEYEVTLGEIQEDYAALVSGDNVFRATQYPLGTAKYKAFSDKVSREQRELTKLDADMKAEQQAEVGERKARLYSDSIARHKKVIEVDLPALVPLIFDHHKELTQPELEIINGFENILSPLLNQAPATFAGLSLPASVQARLTSTPDVSLINGAAALTHASSVASQLLPGAAGLPPQAHPAAGRYPGQGSLYKPYREHDYPAFKGIVEEFGAWKTEWVDKILPGMSEAKALRELNRCTPRNLDLSIYDSVEEIWR